MNRAITLTKNERLQDILNRLRIAPPVNSRDSALALMKEVFDAVESSIPEADRMFPPVAEMAEDHAVQVQRYRHTGHDTLIADNGAFPS